MRSKMVRRCTVVMCAAMLAAGCREYGTAGIDGTGAPLVVHAYGRVGEFGSIWVNDVRYDTSNATFTINGQPGREDHLGIGDIVLIEATVEPDASSGVAARVVFDHVLQGPIASIEANGGSLIALGQTVEITADTLFDDTVPGGIASLMAGDFINVSGFRTANGAIVATRVGSQVPGAHELKTTGVATNVATDDKRFNITALVVDYSTAALTGEAADAAIAHGDIVSVKGSSLGTEGELVAASVDLRRKPIAGNAGDRVDIEGYITKVDPDDPLSFRVSDVPVTTTDETVFDGILTLDAAINVKGSLNSSGVVLASGVNVGRTAGGPDFPAGSHVVEGQIFDPFLGMLAGAAVNLRVQGAWGGYSYWWAHGPLYSDQAGRFSAPHLPDSQITVYAWQDGFVQPCAVIIDLRGSIDVTIEMASESTLNAVSPPRPQSAREPSLTGMIYELTETGRQPVAGARLWAEHFFENPYATTMSDLEGRYYLCNVPPLTTALWATKPGFESTVIELIDTSQSTVLDIELKRR